MKKVISVSIVIVMCMCLLMAFTSCSSKHPIDEFKERMEKADSYQMSITMSDVPFFGTFTITTKVDGNIQYTPAVMFNEEEYTETVGDVEYKYTKDDSGKWTKTKVEDTDDDSSSIYGDDSLNKLFNPDNFEKVKGEENTYKQKDDVDFEDYENVKITIEDDSCTIEMKANSDGMTCGVKIVISEIGKIELKLPEINENVNQQENKIQSVNAGDKIITDSMEIKINSVELTYDVLPDDTSGSYTHYPADAGKVYIAVDASVTNKAKQNLDCDEIGKIVADYNNGYTYHGFVVVKDSNSFTSYASIIPLETKGIKWLIECPEEVEKSSNPLFLEFTIDGEQYKLVIR